MLTKNEKKCSRCGEPWFDSEIVIEGLYVVCSHCGLFPFEWTHCWNLPCKSFEFPKNDPDRNRAYGYHCPKCGKSLREHPFFGKGKQFDLGVGRKLGRWIYKTSASAKANIYRRYGFPVTVELLKLIDKERKEEIDKKKEDKKIHKQQPFKFQFIN